MTELLPLAFKGSVFFAMALFLVQAVFLWRQKTLPALLRPLSYLSYALVALVGCFMLLQSMDKPFSYAQVAPMILLFVAVSSTLKAQRNEATLIQRKAGIVIAAIAYIGMASLI